MQEVRESCALQTTVRNAFEVLMNAQRQLSQKSVPDTIAEPKTNKQKLMNSVINFLVAENCAWRNNEVSSSGASLVHALTDALWTIDRHHHVLGSQGHKISSKFSQFNRTDTELTLQHLSFHPLLHYSGIRKLVSIM